MTTYIAHYPFISAKAKTVFDETIKEKQLIKERALGLESCGTDKVILDIMTSLGWTKLCKKPDEGTLKLVREFYANLEKKVEDKVFIRGKWVTITSDIINKLIKDASQSFTTPNQSVQPSVRMESVS